MPGFEEYNCGGLACVAERCVLFHVRTRVHREDTACHRGLLQSVCALLSETGAHIEPGVRTIQLDLIPSEVLRVAYLYLPPSTGVTVPVAAPHSYMCPADLSLC